MYTSLPQNRQLGHISVATGRIPSLFCDNSAAQCDCLCGHKLPVVVGVVLMLQQMVYR